MAHAILRIDNMQATYDFSLLRSGLFYDANDAQADVDNGTPVNVGALITGERELRKLTPADDDATLVLGIVTTPELDSTLYVETADLSEYVTKAGVPCRVHLLQMGDIFSVSSEVFAAVPTKGTALGVDGGLFDSTATAKVVKCIDIETVSGTTLYVLEVGVDAINQ